VDALRSAGDQADPTASTCEDGSEIQRDHGDLPAGCVEASCESAERYDTTTHLVPPAPPPPDEGQEQQYQPFDGGDVRTDGWAGPTVSIYGTFSKFDLRAIPRPAGDEVTVKATFTVSGRDELLNARQDAKSAHEIRKLWILNWRPWRLGGVFFPFSLCLSFSRISRGDSSLRLRLDWLDGTWAVFHQHLEGIR